MISQLNSEAANGDFTGGQSRIALRRICEIHRVISRGRYPNCRTLAESLEVTPKTVQRDLKFMREELELPLSYHETEYGYFYTKPVGEFPLVRSSVDDLVALFLAQQALEPLKGSPLELTLKDSFRRIAASMSGEVTFQWSDLDQAFSVQPGAAGALKQRDLVLFEKLGRAVLECRRVTFDYLKRDADEWESRSLQPYHLLQLDGGWYVIGFDPQRSAKRTFALQRMKGFRMLKSKFARPTDFDLNEHLGGSFGVWSSGALGEGDSHLIRLKFRGWAARFVGERRWHPSQEVVETRTGDDDQEMLEMTLELSGFEEVRRWILSWGANVEVLEPVELRDDVAGELRAAVGIYG